MLLYLQAFHALKVELWATDLRYLYKSSSLLASAVPREVELPLLGPRIRVTLQRTAISTFISGPLLEGVLFLSDRGSFFGSPLNVSTSPSGWAVLKGSTPMHFDLDLLSFYMHSSQYTTFIWNSYFVVMDHA